MYCTKTDSPAKTKSDVTTGSRIGTFKATDLFSTCEVADSKTKAFFNIFSAPNLTVSHFPLEPFWLPRKLTNAINISVLVFDLWNEIFVHICGLNELQLNIMHWMR